MNFIISFSYLSFQLACLLFLVALLERCNPFALVVDVHEILIDVWFLLFERDRRQVSVAFDVLAGLNWTLLENDLLALNRLMNFSALSNHPTFESWHLNHEPFPLYLCLSEIATLLSYLLLPLHHERVLKWPNDIVDPELTERLSRCIGFILEISEASIHLGFGLLCHMCISRLCLLFGTFLQLPPCLHDHVVRTFASLMFLIW